MSECVVRMEMNGVPDCCGLCDPLFAVVCATKHDQTIDKMMLRAGRPSWCPIICSLPEGHGRLVDEKSVRWAIDDIVLEIANRTGRVEMTKDETMEYINNLCTIVPAEGSKT